MNDDEVRQMAAEGVTVAHCPKSNLKLASGIAEIARLRSAGVVIGLDTDSAASNNTLDMIVACVDRSHLRSQPLYDPVSQLVYTACSSQVTDTWVAGRHLVEAGE